MKTVRFSQVVARSGEPHVHTLWIAPEKDPEFSRARKTDRVMTVQRGASADFGTVGYEPGQQYLVFPKSLKRFAAKRVVGIKFDLIEQPKPVPASVESRRPRGKSRPPIRAAGRGKPPAARSSAGDAASGVGLAPNRRRPEIVLEPEAGEPTMGDKAVRGVAANAPNDADALRREVRAALKELKAGKAVAAYQRLERAVDK